MPTTLVMAPQIETQAYLTTREVADLLRCHEETVLYLIHSGRINPVLKLGRRYRIPLTSIQSLKAE